MNIFNKTIKKLHQISGLVIALFFVMWFVSGIILLYHKYPRVTQEDTYAKMESLSKKELPSIYDIPGLSDTAKIKTLSVYKSMGKTEWTISGISSRKDNPMESKPDTGNRFFLAGDTLIASSEVTADQIDSIACNWSGSSSILKIDTLKKRQQWVLYERYEKSLPILRYYFDNPEKTEVFISQKSGEVLQSTTRSERVWSWFGAIPHKFYLTCLRTDVELWKKTLLIGGLLCLVAALSGFYLGIYYLFVNKRKHDSFSSPFKKKIWKWHHVGGLIFGLFLIAWGISGSLAMQRVPKWMVNYDGDYFVSSSKLWGKKPLPLGAYNLDYRLLLNAYPDVKQISWTHFGSLPAYMIVSGDKEIYVDASKENEIRPLNIPNEEIEKAIKRYFGEDIKYEISLQSEYDEYYLSSPGVYPLPVWRIDVDNEDGSRMYVSPSDGYVKYLNENRMVKKWLFSACHYLDIKYFVLHKTLRYTCLWILAIGCVFVIVTGVAIFFSKETNKRRK